MRVTCPTCGAQYEIAGAMLPAPGRHVQCSACHTRWFVRSEAPKVEENEDDIVRRLEARSHLRAVPSPAPPAPPPVAEPPAEVVEPEEAEPAPEPAPDVQPVARPVPERPGAVTPLAPTAAPAKPAERPMVRSEGVVLRPAPRIELGEAMAPSPQPARTTKPKRSGFGRGLLVVLILLGIAVGVYVWRAPIAASVPAVAPALGAYGRAVDDLRMKLDEAVEGFRR